MKNDSEVMIDTPMLQSVLSVKRSFSDSFSLSGLCGGLDKKMKFCNISSPSDTSETSEDPEIYTPEQPQYVVAANTAQGCVGVRAKPCLRSRLICRLPNNTMVTQSEKRGKWIKHNRGGWSMIKYKQMTLMQRLDPVPVGNRMTSMTVIISGALKERRFLNWFALTKDRPAYSTEGTVFMAAVENHYITCKYDGQDGLDSPNKRFLLGGYLEDTIPNCGVSFKFSATTNTLEIHTTIDPNRHEATRHTILQPDFPCYVLIENKTIRINRSNIKNIVEYLR